ncbi:MAG: hypothetical protein HFJ17_04405 [Clostridia bacterium]|nr:hypothetical protein [Clostridia bacterium]
MNQIEKKYIILGSLCAFLVTLVVGYAAFQSVLKIKGTSTITSNWDIQITNIVSKNIQGTASNKEEPSYNNENGLSATFKTNLETPGDSIEYDITIENKGNINAKLDKITLSDSKSTAIKFTTTGLEEGNQLKVGESTILTVKVEYLKGVELEEENMTANVTVTLEYSQLNVNDEGIAIPPFPATDLANNIVTTGDGLYTNGDNRYVYKGANPNNYIEFNNELWRIIALESDGTLKIVKNDSIGNRAWDSTGYRTTGYCSLGGAPTYGCNAWMKGTFIYNQQSAQVDKNAEINTYLNGEYYNSLNLNSKMLIVEHNFDVGFVTDNNSNLVSQVAEEKSKIWSGNIGLISVSDYIKANANTAQCGNFNLHVSNNEVCKQTNYLFKSYSYWTITPRINYTNTVYLIATDGTISGMTARNTWVPIIPVVFLKSGLTLEGKGTENNPYVIID